MKKKEKKKYKNTGSYDKGKKFHNRFINVFIKYILHS